MDKHEKKEVKEEKPKKESKKRGPSKEYLDAKSFTKFVKDVSKT